MYARARTKLSTLSNDPVISCLFIMACEIACVLHEMYRLRYVVVTTGGILFVALFAMMAGLMAGLAFHFHAARQQRGSIKAYEEMVDRMIYTTGAMSAPQQRRFIHRARLN